MWFVLDASDSSFCTVHEKNILQAGKGIDVDDKVTFFYRGKEYSGIVVFKDRDNVKCTEEMNRLMKERKEMPKPVAKPTEVTLPNKRTRAQYIPEVSAPEVVIKKLKKKKEDAPQMSQKEKDRQRILNLNRAEAEKQKNMLLLSKSKVQLRKKADEDDDWHPLNDEESQDSVVNMGAHKTMLKLNHKEIVSALQNPSESGDQSPRADGDQSPFHIPSPSNSPNRYKYDDRDMMETTEGERKEDNDGDMIETTDCEKEDLIRKIQMLEKQLKEKENSENHGHSQEKAKEKEKDEKCNSKSSVKKKKSSKDEDDSVIVDELFEVGDGELDIEKVRDETLEYQLYGPRDDTREMSKNIYVKKDILTKTLTNATNIKHVIRRLMTGVFIPSKIIGCTVTGQAWRVGNKDDKRESPKPLHQGALKAIVSCANAVAKQKKWKTAPLKVSDATSTFSVRLVEIRQLVKNGKLQD